MATILFPSQRSRGAIETYLGIGDIPNSPEHLIALECCLQAAEDYVALTDDQKHVQPGSKTWLNIQEELNDIEKFFLETPWTSLSGYEGEYLFNNLLKRIAKEKEKEEVNMVSTT